MPKSGNDSKTIASYLLIIGGILALLPNLPIINETLSIYRYEADILGTKFTGGINFLGSYGNFSSTFQPKVTGWTLLGLQGEVLFAIFVIIGVAAIVVGLLLKTSPLMKLTGIVGGLVGLIMSVLVYIGDSQKQNNFGLSYFTFPKIEFIGAGFWVILLGCILIFAGGLLVLKE